MSEQAYDRSESADRLETPPPLPNGELVHWMARKPLRVGPAGVSATAGAAFALGAVTAVAVLALAHWLGPERAVVARRLGSRL
jgi:hypothetical protein